MPKNKQKLASLVLSVVIASVMPGVSALASTNRTFTASISPTTTVAGSVQPFSIAIQNTSNKGTIRAAIIDVPAGFNLDTQTLALGGSAPANWSARYLNGHIYIAKTSSGKNSGIAPTKTFSVSFSATAPTALANYTFAVSAYKEKFEIDRDNDDNEDDEPDFSIVGGQPMVTVISGAPIEFFTTGAGIKSPAGAQDISITITANSFVLGAATILHSAKFYTLENPPASFSGNLSWYIFGDNAGAPGTMLYSGTTGAVTRTDLGQVASGVPGFNYEEFENSFDLPNLNLAPGTYWLGLHNGPDQVISTLRSMYWEASPTGSSPYSNYTYLPPFGPGLPNWIANPGAQLAFSLYK